MESQEAGFPPFPTLFGNPFGVATFPRPRLLAYFKAQKQERPNPKPLDLEGVVMEVLGPKCNGRSSTLNGPPSRGDDIDGIGCQLGSKVPDIITSGLLYIFVEAPEENA